MVEGFLSELDPGERDDLEKLGTVRRYRRGDVLFHQGDDAGRRASSSSTGTSRPR